MDELLARLLPVCGKQAVCAALSEVWLLSLVALCASLFHSLFRVVFRVVCECARAIPSWTRARPPHLPLSLLCRYLSLSRHCRLCRPAISLSSLCRCRRSTLAACRTCRCLCAACTAALSHCWLVPSSPSLPLSSPLPSSASAHLRLFPLLRCAGWLMMSIRADSWNKKQYTEHH